MAEQPSLEDRLRTNYNETGVAVMQALYSDDYLSIGGTESTRELAARAAVTGTSRVLDVGCGIGGPALWLAGEIGCTVEGVDLVPSSIAEASQRALARGLADKATFREADALALPFDDGSFDVVWGQDAWCHVPDKAGLLSEARRVLRPGGTIAFTDWLRGTGMEPHARQAALEAALSPLAATADEYERMLADAGFATPHVEDIGATFVDQYRTVCARLDHDRDDLIERFGLRVYEIVREINTTILHGFEQGGIGGGRCVATAR